jgi:hypothetical protein
MLLAMRGKYVELMRNANASEVLELAYNDYANAQQRYAIACEFYGPECALSNMVKCFLRDLKFVLFFWDTDTLLQ